MTTFISLASSATMFPLSGGILTSALTPVMIEDRMSKVAVVSALNNDHEATIDAIKRRHGLELPKSIPGPDGRAPKVALQPGDELFIIQASLPRLKEGERHSDETVASAPISFLRWRVPMQIATPAPAGIPQLVFNTLIDHAYSIALWQRGETQLKAANVLIDDLADELKELEEAVRYANATLIADVLLECADVLYKSVCIAYVTGTSPLPLFAENDEAERNFVLAMDAAILKYGRRAQGLPKDIKIERALITTILAASKPR